MVLLNPMLCCVMLNNSFNNFVFCIISFYSIKIQKQHVEILTAPVMTTI